MRFIGPTILTAHTLVIHVVSGIPIVTNLLD